MIEWMYICYKKNMKNKQKEWHTATKPFKTYLRILLVRFVNLRNL